MSEELAVESQAPAEVQAKAEEMGWIPPTRFRGDPERFVDADEFIKRGETVLPIVKAQLEKERAVNQRTAERLNSVEAALAKATKALEEVEERHSVATQKAVEAARRDVQEQLEAALEAGDHKGAAALTLEVAKLERASEESPAKKEEPAKQEQVQIPAEVVKFAEENPWYGKDRRKTALYMAICQELRDAGDTSTGTTFFAKALREMHKDTDERPSDDKVEGARGSGDDAPRGSGRGKSFANMPADARAACDADARNFVGEGKKFKTLAEWRSRYTELYFQE